MTKITLLTALALGTLTASLSAQTQAKKTKKSDAAAMKAIKLGKNIPDAFYHKPGFVISPYKPYNVLNVKHLKPGDYARDPFTAIVNRQTKKREISTAKIFRVPQPRPVAPATQQAANQ